MQSLVKTRCAQKICQKSAERSTQLGLSTGVAAKLTTDWNLAAKSRQDKYSIELRTAKIFLMADAGFCSRVNQDSWRNLHQTMALKHGWNRARHVRVKIGLAPARYPVEVESFLEVVREDFRGKEELSNVTVLAVNTRNLSEKKSNEVVAWACGSSSFRMDRMQKKRKLCLQPICRSRLVVLDVKKERPARENGPDLESFRLLKKCLCGTMFVHVERNIGLLVHGDDFRVEMPTREEK